MNKSNNNTAIPRMFQLWEEITHGNDEIKKEKKGENL